MKNNTQPIADLMDEAINTLQKVNKTKTFDVVRSPIIGVKYHVKWAYKDAAFRLVDIGEFYCILKADRSRKLITCKHNELLHTNSSAKHQNINL